jgi:alanine dehydrogenase
MTNKENSFIPQPEPVEISSKPRRIVIGLPRCEAPGERRFPLTPEAVDMLGDRGFLVRMEAGAASSIHYDDVRYMAAGAEIVSRAEAFAADMVIYLAAPTVPDIKLMRRGALLFTKLNAERQSSLAIKELMHRHIISVAIDLIRDSDNHTPFYDILSEIDGRAAVMLGATLLAGMGHGKGMLLGGVTGIVPCEVTIIGSGIGACAAAASAVGAGATVRMLDNDVYRLREATRLFPGIITSALHTRVLRHSLRTADIVIATEVDPHFVINSDLVEEMKHEVVIMDINHDCSPMFPSLKAIDIAGFTNFAGEAHPGRVCYVGAGNAVPRTAAMALGNTFLKLMNDIIACDGVANTVKMLPGMQRAVFTYMGKAVNAHIAKIAGTRVMDISLLLNCC